MPGYRVLIDDNYHFMEKSERITYDLFATADEAIAAFAMAYRDRTLSDFTALQSAAKAGRVTLAT